MEMHSTLSNSIFSISVFSVFSIVSFPNEACISSLDNTNGESSHSYICLFHIWYNFLDNRYKKFFHMLKTSKPGPPTIT